MDNAKERLEEANALFLEEIVGKLMLVIYKDDLGKTRTREWIFAGKDNYSYYFINPATDKHEILSVKVYVRMEELGAGSKFRSSIQVGGARGESGILNNNFKENKNLIKKSGSKISKGGEHAR